MADSALLTAPIRTGRIYQSQSGRVTACADCCDKLPLFLPSGYQSLPPEGELGLLLPLGDGYLLAGTACTPQGLEPGEIRLQSAGGAWIHLKNTGEVLINGLTILPDGTFQPKKEDA